MKISDNIITNKMKKEINKQEIIRSKEEIKHKKEKEKMKYFVG